MERYSGDFLAAVDGLRALLGCRGYVWPISVEQATLCAEYADGEITRGEVEVDKGHARGHHVTRVWLEPSAPLHPSVKSAITTFDAIVIGPGSFFTSLMPTLLVDGVADVIAGVSGPVIVVSNLLTEGQGMRRFTAADEVAWISKTIGRKVDVLIANEGYPSEEAVARYAAEHKHPLPLGDLEHGTEAVVGEFWRSEIARHDRRRLSYAVWSVLSQRLLA
jgi:uncharacterized cofD-like protein